MAEQVCGYGGGMLVLYASNINGNGMLDCRGQNGVIGGLAGNNYYAASGGGGGGFVAEISVTSQKSDVVINARGGGGGKYSTPTGTTATSGARSKWNTNKRYINNW